MKYLIILFTLFTLNLNAQNYVGAELGRNNYGFTLYNELEPDSSFVVGGFKTVVSENSEIKLRAGVKIGSPKLHVVLYLPVLNYSFEAKKFNTPYNAEVRFTFQKGLLQDFKAVVGVEIYKDQTYPYISVMLPFTTHKRNYKHQSF